jgi:hypothetical protein
VLAVLSVIVGLSSMGLLEPDNNPRPPELSVLRQQLPVKTEHGQIAKERLGLLKPVGASEGYGGIGEAGIKFIEYLTGKSPGDILKGLLDSPVPVDNTTVAKSSPYPGFTLDLERVKETLADMETGAYTNKNIWNHGKTSAWGRHQIASALASDVLKNIPGNDPKDKNFKKYVVDFIREGKDRVNALRKNPNNVPKHFKGGAAGRIAESRHNTHYPRLVDLAIREKLRIINAKGRDINDPREIAKAWYGSTSKEENEKYSEKFMKFWNKK